MKKLFLFSLLLAFVATAGFSQGVSGGIKAGLNIANVTASSSGASASPSSKAGLLIGGYLTIKTSEKFGIQPELLYSQMGYSAPSGFTGSASLSYLSIPLMARYNVSENISLQAGPQLGLLLSATGDPGSVDIKDQFNGADFGGAFGLGGDFGKFNASARYYLGFSNISKNAPSGSSLTNNAIQLSIGCKLFGE